MRQRKAYPAVLVTTSFNDSQVMYWEPAKYVAKLRSLKTDGNELLLKCKLEPAGHGGASGRYDRLRDTAFEYAWMLKQVGITKQGLLGTQDDDRIVTFTLLLPPVAGALTDVGLTV